MKSQLWWIDAFHGCSTSHLHRCPSCFLLWRGSWPSTWTSSESPVLWARIAPHWNLWANWWFALRSSACSWSFGSFPVAAVERCPWTPSSILAGCWFLPYSSPLPWQYWILSFAKLIQMDLPLWFLVRALFASILTNTPFWWCCRSAASFATRWPSLPGPFTLPWFLDILGPVFFSFKTNYYILILLLPINIEKMPDRIELLSRNWCICVS